VKRATRTAIAFARVSLCLCSAAGCAYQPKATDAVRDSETAIAIAKAACLHGARDTGHWSAGLKFGLWEVTQTFGDNKLGCSWGVRVAVWPDNGKTKRCEECVVET
jgi:hypothetical protein